MTPAYFLAHILAMHLSVPEPITFTLRELNGRCAQILRFGDGEIPRAWSLEYDRACWAKYPKLRARVIAHEACHAAYDYNTPAWESLTYAEQGERHGRISDCVNKILRDCVVSRLRTVIDTRAKPNAERALRARAEYQELSEREAR